MVSLKLIIELDKNTSLVTEAEIKETEEDFEVLIPEKVSNLINLYLKKNIKAVYLNG